MMKLVYVISRKDGLSHADFATYWRQQHGPLVARSAEAIGALRYVQSHLFDHPANEAMRSVRGMLPPVDGITEVWWESRTAFEAAYATPAGQAAACRLAEDEAKFIDFSASQVFLTEEHPIFDHRDRRPLAPDALKVTYLLAGRDGLSQAEVHRTWLQDHGPLVAFHAETLRMARYVQSHTIHPDLNASFQAARGYLPPLDGITEVWMASPADLEASGATDEGRAAAQALVDDERRFVEIGRSRCFLTAEHPIFDRTG
jgi:uncharacterized protein (TIGR02118 family)